jgi:hypothetical protein
VVTVFGATDTDVISGDLSVLVANLRMNRSSSRNRFDTDTVREESAMARPETPGASGAPEDGERDTGSIVIDCDDCAVRGVGCQDCVVSFLLGIPETLLDGCGSFRFTGMGNPGLPSDTRHAGRGGYSRCAC